MRRLYFLVPDSATARKIVDDLLGSEVEERHIHIVARDHELLRQENLPEAGVLEERDVIPAAKRGAAAGGATGLLAGIAAVTVPGLGLALGGGALLALTAAGATFGAFVSPLVGASAPNSRLVEYEEAIRAGHLLMLVDVPKERLDDIEALVLRHHPQAQVHRTDASATPGAS